MLTRSEAPGTLDALAAHFAAAVGHFLAMGSPFNARLAAACADAPELLALASEAAPGQPPSYLLLGAVHDLLLERTDTPLGQYYPSITERPLPHAGLSEAFRAFCQERREEVSAIVKARKVQFTTAERAALLLPAMLHVAREAGEPLSLIEIGASAGVLTLFDRYRYEYGRAGACGAPGAPRISGCSFRDIPPLPGAPPSIGRRTGVDLHPIDPRIPAQRRWLDALLPPDWAQERRSLRACLELRAQTPLEIHAGDALDVVPAIVATRGEPICVFHANCLYQWPAPLHQALEILLREASLGRTIHRIGMELRGPPAEPEPARRPDEPLLSYETIHIVYRDGDRRERRLALHDGFGKGGVWLAPADGYR